jgi:hypothetical protein
VLAYEGAAKARSPTELEGRTLPSEGQPSSSTSLSANGTLIIALPELPGTRAVMAVIVRGLGYTALDYMLYYRLIDHVGEERAALAN